jgi:hypothetical protein
VRKIPTLFVRDPEDMRRVLPEPHPDAAWVLAGEGVATRKYDGTCVLLHDHQWWARREVKPGKQTPPGFVPEQTDDVTGKTVGWEPAEQSGFAKWLGEATRDGMEPGTYELIGPKVNGNPEGFDHHHLVRHSEADVVEAPRSFDELRVFLAEFPHEGIVWHHPDGRMAKLKKRDFPQGGEATRPTR